VGQMRTNSLNPQFKRDTIIIDSLKEYLFNDEFKTKYEYDIFISTDDIDIEAAYNFFGENNIKNIHLIEKNFYLNPIENYIEDYEFFHELYLQTNFIESYDIHLSQLYQYYRLYDAYNMLKNYQNKSNITYDYAIRLRPDTSLNKNLMELFNKLENTDIKIILEHNLFQICKFEFSEIFNVIETYGTYNDPIEKRYNYYQAFLTPNPSTPLYPENIMMYCSEKQIADNIVYILDKYNYDVTKHFLGIRYPNFVKLHR
jgi:hypothetical protein